jgi:hypothetical protein
MQRMPGGLPSLQSRAFTGCMHNQSRHLLKTLSKEMKTGKADEHDNNDDGASARFYR